MPDDTGSLGSDTGLGIKRPTNMNLHHQPAPKHCFRTAVACLTGMDPVDVPHFLEDDDGGMYVRMQEWLTENGWYMIRMQHCIRSAWTSNSIEALEQVMEWAAGTDAPETKNTPARRYILAAKDRGLPHAFVCEGDKIIHNPNGGHCMDGRYPNGTDGWNIR